MPINSHSDDDTTPTSDLHSLAQQAEKNGDWQTAVRLYAQCYEQRQAELCLLNSVQVGLSARVEMQSIYTMVGDLLRDTFNAQIVMISQYDPHTDRVFHHYAIENGVHILADHWLSIDTARAEIVHTKKTLLLNQEQLLERVKQNKMHVLPGTQMPKTWLGVPLMVGQEVRGIVSLQNVDVQNAFTPSDINLLISLTSTMAISLENARLYKETQRLLDLLEGEMEIARQTQQSILPTKLPTTRGYEYGALIKPAHAVSGDFYDFIPVGSDRICFVVGDVTDKGLPAALFMALTFSLVRSETTRGTAPRILIQNVNRALLNMNASGMFVTLLYCCLDVRTGVLHYCRAGHPQPIVLDASGALLSLKMVTGQPLGIFEDIEIDEQQVKIEPGGAALFFTDGLCEAVNDQGAEFGNAQVRRLFRQLREENPSQICERLYDEIQVHCGDIQRQDDFTAVVVKRLKHL